MEKNNKNKAENKSINPSIRGKRKEKVRIVVKSYYVGTEPMKDVIGRAAVNSCLKKVDKTA